MSFWLKDQNVWGSETFCLPGRGMFQFEFYFEICSLPVTNCRGNNFQAMGEIVLNKLTNESWDSESFREKTNSCNKNKLKWKPRIRIIISPNTGRKRKHLGSHHNINDLVYLIISTIILQGGENIQRLSLWHLISIDKMQEISILKLKAVYKRNTLK